MSNLNGILVEKIIGSGPSDDNEYALITYVSRGKEAVLAIPKGQLFSMIDVCAKEESRDRPPPIGNAWAHLFTVKALGVGTSEGRAGASLFLTLGNGGTLGFFLPDNSPEESRTMLAARNDTPTPRPSGTQIH